MLTGFLDAGTLITVMTAGQPTGFAGTVLSLEQTLAIFTTSAQSTMIIPLAHITNIEALS
ncbi:hypothetical protein [Paenibacillus sp. KS-LC4]|uniref:hypothetical protein n=1 Tax=Paenibacillus sp. KS-LC4 TaxID=2979727 RepID=UPI0030D3837D